MSAAAARRTVGAVRVARDPISRLQRAIDALPADTRRAMLEGIRRRPIVAGAYTDGRGGICPMLAAHREGSRTTLLAFARAWDGFARTRRVRRATPRELRILRDLLTVSLERESPGDFAAAIAEHRAAVARRRADVPEIRVRRLGVDAPVLAARRGRGGAPSWSAGPQTIHPDDARAIDPGRHHDHEAATMTGGSSLSAPCRSGRRAAEGEEARTAS